MKQLKKLALVVAMLVCLLPLLCACGVNSSPEKAATAYIEARYDFDVEAFLKVSFMYNQNILEKYSEDYDEDEYNEMIDALYEDAEEAREEFDDYDDFYLDFEIKRVTIYEEGDDEYDENIGMFSDDAEDFIEALAEIKVKGELVYVDGDDEEEEDLDTVLTGVCIDGKWYIFG